MAKSVYDFSVKTIEGVEKSLKDYEGKTLLIVNTASKCGFTPQYEDLEAVYKEYKNQGFEILAFPCNQFGAQEPGNAEEIKNFCQLNYSVDFPLFDKIEVNGPGAHPLFNFLKESNPGLLGTEAIKWNFTKFVVDKNGQPVKRFAPTDKPQKIMEYIKQLL